MLNDISLDRKKKRAIRDIKDWKSLSPAAKQIVQAYRALPVTNRPDLDIVSYVRALDVKYKLVGVDDYRRDDGTTSCHCNTYLWDFRDKGYRCDYQDYHDIRNEIAGIRKAIEDQAHEFKIAGIQHSLDERDSILESLRTEARIVHEVTTKYKEIA